MQIGITNPLLAPILFEHMAEKSLPFHLSRDVLRQISLKKSLKPVNRSGVNRIIDANLNRLKEGLRVCEEFTRFVWNDRLLSKELKNIRHCINDIVSNQYSLDKYYKVRDVHNDVGKSVHTVQELRRYSAQDIFFANIQRVKESLRVLEECYKLYNTQLALKFKSIRYTIYSFEKKVAHKFISTR